MAVMKPMTKPGGQLVHVPRATVTPAQANGERILAEHVGMPAALGKATATAVLKHRAIKKPGGHAALLKRLFGE